MIPTVRPNHGNALAAAAGLRRGAVTRGAGGAAVRRRQRPAVYTECRRHSAATSVHGAHADEAAIRPLPKTDALSQLRDMADLAEACPETAERLRACLSPEVRQQIQKLHAELYEDDSVPAPRPDQLYRLALASGLPMIGFGFMDNAVMLIAGDFIDNTLCVTFGLGTLFAAGVGNIISDVAGLTTAGPIEAVSRERIAPHGLHPKQQALVSVLLIKYTALTAGIVTGCVLGMFPLLWPEHLRFWKKVKED